MSTQRKLNKKLDKKLKYIEPPDLNSSEGDLNQFFEQRKAQKKQTMDALFVHYGIKKDLFQCWVKLAWALAEDFVPAMQFQQKRGQPKKWHLETHLSLFALINLYKIDNPSKPMKVVYADVLKEVKGTFLEDIISTETSDKTIQNEYERFMASPAYKMIKYMEDISDKDTKRRYFKEMIGKE
jgi:hypothetical protein